MKSGPRGAQSALARSPGGGDSQPGPGSALQASREGWQFGFRLPHSAIPVWGLLLCYRRKGYCPQPWAPGLTTLAPTRSDVFHSCVDSCFTISTALLPTTTLLSEPHFRREDALNGRGPDRSHSSWHVVMLVWLLPLLVRFINRVKLGWDAYLPPAPPMMKQLIRAHMS